MTYSVEEVLDGESGYQEPVIRESFFIEAAPGEDPVTFAAGLCKERGWDFFKLIWESSTERGVTWKVVAFNEH